MKTKNDKEFEDFVIRVYLNDRSQDYRYGEKRTLDDKKPSKGCRWMTPREMARSLVDKYHINIKNKVDSNG